MKNEWQQGVGGIFLHWEKKVLDGNACLHIQGLENEWVGFIQLLPEYNCDVEFIYKSYPEHPPMPLEDCKKILENKWGELIKREVERFY